jgi:predicted ATPase with chaperone activity
MMIGLLDETSKATRIRRLDLASPATLAETGLREDLITQLVIKLIHFNADCTGAEIASRVGLEFAVVEPVLEQLKRSRQCEVVGGGHLGAPSFRYRISDDGRRRAQLFLQHNQYVGAAPAPLSQYREYMAEFREMTNRTVTPVAIRRAVSHLVLSDSVVNQIGPAVNSGQSIFVYGPPGNGKTVITQALHDLFDGTIGIPHAIEVEGQIIRVYNPINHQAVQADCGDEWTASARLDRRWVRCRRPKVVVGGELTMPSLDLTYLPATGFYNAPIQLMANGGLLVIDDFGRQACSPRELLNRWIVPLDSRVDFLTLQSGQQLQVPFDVLVIFATNLKPSELADEAFLRRIQYKILAENPTPAAFKLIFENCCREHDLPFDETLADIVINDCMATGTPLRGCYPRDLIGRAVSQIEYFSLAPRLTRGLMESVWANYFARDQDA